MTMFGEVFQIGYVVKDMESALEHWTKTLQVGPFYTVDITTPSLVYGEEVTARSRIALSQWNDLQVELIYPLDDAPTIYKAFLDSGREGLHHLGSLTPDFSRDDEQVVASGIKRAQVGSLMGTRFTYYETDTHFQGTMVELLEATPFFLDVIDKLKAGTRNWDGTEPVRPLKQLF